jgi:hypothetical protein
MQEASRRGDGLYEIAPNGAMKKILSYESARLDVRAKVPIILAPRRAATTSGARPRGRRRATRAAASRGSPDDDDPAPGGAGLQRRQRLRVVAPDPFRRDVDAWLGPA